jgi:hypothetical protein
LPSCKSARQADQAQGRGFIQFLILLKGVNITAMMKPAVIGFLAMVPLLIDVCEAGTPAAMVSPDIHHVQDSGGAQSDVQLQSAVTRAMQTSALTANSQIVVHVTKGEVTLEGAAINQLARREATRLAETVLGVRVVRNRLSVIDTQTAGISPES